MLKFSEIKKQCILVSILFCVQVSFCDILVSDGEVVTIENENDVVLADENLSIINGSELTILDSYVQIDGNLSIGDNDEGNNTVRVICSENLQTYIKPHLTIAGNLNIGGKSDNNTLIIEGVGYNSDNTYSPYSLTYVDADNVVIDGNGNSLVLRNGGWVNTPWRDDCSVQLYNGGLLDIGAGSGIVTDDYFQSSDSVLKFGLSKNDNGHLGFIHTINIEKGAKVIFYGVGSIDGVRHGVPLISSLAFNVVDDATYWGDDNYDNVLNILINKMDIVSSLLTFDWDVTYEDYPITIVADITRISLAVCARIEGTDLGEVANEIDRMGLVEDSPAYEMIDRFNLMNGDQQRQALNTLYGQSLPVATTQIQALHDYTRIFRKPKANKVPTDSGKWNSWMEAFGARSDKETTANYNGYNFDHYGTVIGLEREVDQLTYGLALGTSRSDLEDSIGSTADAESYYGTLFGSYTDKGTFLDLSLTYGRSSIDTRTASEFNVSSDYSADLFSVGLLFGKEFNITENIYVIPQLGLQTTYYRQDDYVDNSSDAVRKEVDNYDRWSYLSTVGASVEFRNFFANSSITPEVHIMWDHEFNSDDEYLHYNLSGSNSGLLLRQEGAEEDILRLGFGLSVDLTESFSVTASYDLLLGSDYQSQAVTANLLYKF